ncbi:MAG: FmdB family zinc ribbon protein [Pseudomonadota bacterium]|nr:FmdB family zinc ribbon protein [Pseudomonadota bacterium]
MPIYEYRCENCGHEMDALQKLSDAPLVDCPQCGQPALKKLISAAGFRLKGGGWYETDFKSGKKKNLHESGEKKAGAGAGDKKEKSGGEKKKKAESKPGAASAG